MSDIVEFLRARLAEDEQKARNATKDQDCRRSGEYGLEAMVSGHRKVESAWEQLGYDPARVLAEVESKWRLIQLEFEHAAAIDGEWGCCHNAEQIKLGACTEQRPNDLEGLRALALPYRDHPDFDESWKP